MSPRPAYFEGKDDPGVPDAVGRALEALLEKVDAAALDTVWIFPPLRKGRREHGLIAAGCFRDPVPAGEGDPGNAAERPVGDPSGDSSERDRRLLVTLAYRAEETGKGIDFTARFSEEGEAPPERLPGIIEGVVRRAEAGSGEPRTVRIEGEPERIDDLLLETGREPAPVPEEEVPPQTETTEETRP